MGLKLEIVPISDCEKVNPLKASGEGERIPVPRFEEQSCSPWLVFSCLCHPTVSWAHLALPAPVGLRAFLQLPFTFWKCALGLVEENHINWFSKFSSKVCGIISRKGIDKSSFQSAAVFHAPLHWAARGHANLHGMATVII